MRRSIFTVVAGFLMLLGVVAAPAAADDHANANPKVMSLNLYLGADLSSFDPGLILKTIIATDYEERSESIAAEIDRRNPDLIGLQEVSDISVTFATEGICDPEKLGGAVPGQPQLDYLKILLDDLVAEGEHYNVAASVTNAKVSLPIDFGGGLVVCGNLVDRDVILARASTTTTSNPRSGNYAINFAVPFEPFPDIEFTRGWTTVDAVVGGAAFTFANTHLEVEADPFTGAGFCLVDGAPIPCQIPQATELVQKVLADSSHPTILVGDFNAAPTTPAYRIVRAAGFVDAWDVLLFGKNQQSNTCCQAENLLNQFSLHDERIDLVFIRVDSDPVSVGTVVFDRFWEKTPSGLWPSDHGGVVMRLFYQ